MLNVRYGYNILIIVILLVCIWFVYVSIESHTYYRRMFKRFMWCAVVVYLNRLLSIAMEMGDIPTTDILLYGERILHFCLTVVIYVLYSFFLFCLISPHHFESRRVWWMFFCPLHSDRSLADNIAVDSYIYVCGEWCVL